MALVGVLAALLAVSGCHRSVPRAVITGAKRVRLDALLPLHPAWRDVQQLDALLAHVGTLGRPRPQSALPVGAATLPAALAPAAWASREAQPPSADVIGPALERLEGLKSLFEARTARRLAEMERVSRAKLAVEVDARRRALTAQLALDQALAVLRVRRAAAAEKRSLEFDAIRLRSQVAAWVGAPRLAAAADLRKVEDRIAAIDRALPVQEASARDAALRATEGSIETFRRGLEERAAAERAAEAKTLAAQDDQTIQTYRAQMRTQVAALGGPGARVSPRPAAVPNAQLRSPPELARSSAAPAALRTGAGALAAAAALRAQRERLVAAVRDDLQRRVAVLASQRGWRVAYEPQAAGVDVTDEVAAVLRDQMAGTMSRG